MLFFCCRVNRSLFGDTVLKAGNLFLGQQHQGVYWMCTEYRLSVTPEKIVVQDRDNRKKVPFRIRYSDADSDAAID
jgi:hypothetical protein